MTYSNKNYKITMYFGPSGWTINSDYETMTCEPVRYQRQFKEILDILAEKMKPHAADMKSYFKVKLSFRKNHRAEFRLALDYKAAKNCPLLYN